MIVTIPICTQHAGYPGNIKKYQIKDECPKCGKKRGIERWEGPSYDGSRRLYVDCWKNECGHIDTYSEIRKEGTRIRSS